MTILTELTKWNLNEELKKAQRDLEIGDEDIKREALEYISALCTEINNRDVEF